ncbi:hypothetical protein D3C73_1017350 [compost metagenome]
MMEDPTGSLNFLKTDTMWGAPMQLNFMREDWIRPRAGTNGIIVSPVIPLENTAIPLITSITKPKLINSGLLAG